jgi:hypothetical protein
MCSLACGALATARAPPTIRYVAISVPPIGGVCQPERRQRTCAGCASGATAYARKADVYWPRSCNSGSSPKMNARDATSASDSGSRFGPRNAHSQTVSTRHPACLSASCAFPSRILFPVIFAAQNSGRVAGALNIGQSWPCQKQPCTSTAARWRGNRRSGLPGSSLAWTRKRRPVACRPRLSSISGCVSRPRTRLILWLRCSGVWTSIFRQHPCCQQPRGAKPPLFQQQPCRAGA